MGIALVEDIVKRYGKVVAVEGLSLEVKKVVSLV